MVLLIVGLLTKTAMGPLGAALEHGKRQQAEQQLAHVRQSVYAYVVAYGALPCPLSKNKTRAPASVGLGRLENPSNSNVSCSKAHGYVPAFAMGLSGSVSESGALLDPWGRELLYSVSLDKQSKPNKKSGHVWTTPGRAASLGISKLSASLVLCHASSSSDCRGRGIRSDQIAFAIVSLGADNSGSGNQAENLDEDNYYTVAEESIVAGKEFDDLVTWGSAADTLFWMLKMGWLP